MSGWIQTYTGRKVFPLALTPADVDVRDIAHALSLKCRFTGHCRSFYSVAEHSVRVARIVPPPARLAALLHDAAEAYLPDFAAPIKPHVAFSVNRPAGAPDACLVGASFVEEYLALPAIYAGLGIRADEIARHQRDVKTADRILLATEARDLMGPPPEPWGLDVEPLADGIEPMTPTEAEHLFLVEFARLVMPDNVIDFGRTPVVIR